MLEVQKMSPTPPMSSVWAKVPQVQWSQPLCKKVQAEKQTNPVGPRAGNRRITADQGREKRLLASFWCEKSGKSIELIFQLDTAASCNVMSF